MRVGKVSENVLKRSVLKQCKAKQEDMVQGPRVGGDCAIFHVGGKQQVVSAMQAAVVDTPEKMRYLLCHAANNVLCGGGMPVSASISLMMPEQAEEAQLRSLMEAADVCCQEMDIALSGGHTQVTRAVAQTVASVSVIGWKEEMAQKSEPEAGMDLVMTGFAGMEGAAILARQKEADLREKFPLDMVEEAKRFDAHLFVNPEAEIARRCGAAAMHDISQGGVFGALWELGEKTGLGMEVSLRKIPLRQETVEICEFFGLNPYCLLSGGALLIAVKDGQRLCMELAKKGILAALIGRTTDKKDRALINGEEYRFLEKPAQDEIFKVGEEELWQN